MNLTTFSPYWITLPIGLLMFASLMYSLYDLSKERQLSFDYSYGLALLGLRISYDESDNPTTVQLGLILSDAAPAALQYEMEQFDVIIENFINMKPQLSNKGAVISRGAMSIFFLPKFNRDQLPAGERMTGVVRYTARYGHPDGKFIRRAHKELTFTARVKPKGSDIVYLIDKESDTEIKD